MNSATVAEHDAFPSGEGMTCGLNKREYFAAMAMQGILSNIDGYDQYPSNVSNQAVSLADALINALNK